MSASHEIALEVPDAHTTADLRRLLDYVDANAPTTATVTATAGKIVARWSTDPTEAPTRNTGGTFGFGPVADGVST